MTEPCSANKKPRGQNTIMDIKNHIRINNVTYIAKQLLHTDICDALIQHDAKFALDIQQLKALLHRYAYATANERPKGVSTIEWVEQLGQELIRRTQHCVEQLSEKAQHQLLEEEVLIT